MSIKPLQKLTGTGGQDHVLSQADALTKNMHGLKCYGQKLMDYEIAAISIVFFVLVMITIVETLTLGPQRLTTWRMGIARQIIQNQTFRFFAY